MTKKIQLVGKNAERAQLAADIAGVDVGAFLTEVATSSPFNIHGRCIMCKQTEADGHLHDCKWVGLNRMLLGV